MFVRKEHTNKETWKWERSFMHNKAVKWGEACVAETKDALQDRYLYCLLVLP
jgi:hypothetical protein